MRSPLSPRKSGCILQAAAHCSDKYLDFQCSWNPRKLSYSMQWPYTAGTTLCILNVDLFIIHFHMKKLIFTFIFHSCMLENWLIIYMYMYDMMDYFALSTYFSHIKTLYIFQVIFLSNSVKLLIILNIPCLQLQYLVCTTLSTLTGAYHLLPCSNTTFYEP